MTTKTTILEKGDIFFIYRPKVQESQDDNSVPQSVEDISRFYLVLHPDHSKLYRLFIIGKKRLPEAKTHAKHWATIEMVTTRISELKDYFKAEAYSTKTRGERLLPEARACGEGVYAIVSQEKQTYLSYQLELPQQLGEVQEELALEPEASFVFSIKNQKTAGIQGGKAADFPQKLQAHFRDLRFIPVNPPDFLNYPGAELLLIGASDDISEELGIDLKPEDMTFNTAEIFTDLKLWKNERTIKPLFEGQWQ